LFRPHRCLATPDLFLDSMPDQRIGETRPIDCTESLGNIYMNRSQICHPKSKLTEMFSWESLFILSRLSMRWSTKSSVGVNPQGRSVEKVKLLLNDSHLDPQVVRSERHRGDDDLEYQKPNRKEQKPPT
jgi:hypothetical protein